MIDSVGIGQQRDREPVFVICNSRSGSTLLRFLLDAHPELACPPETNMPALFAQLATVWSVIEGAPLSPSREDELPEVPEAAISGIRHTVDALISSCLKRRGKQQYCDKSLGTARYVDLLLRVYPDAKLLCLYRHPMDVIASGIEACPWGLRGYGFDPYIAQTPGNAVLALARFWADNSAAALGIEERYPDNCLRTRYEDLVADPEHEAARIFSFLGASPAPGITAACFSRERERFGPADYKIWGTSRITSDSVGRGWSVPAEMVPPPVLAQLNELTGKLGYIPIDDGWGASEPPRDMRVQCESEDATPASAQHEYCDDEQPAVKNGRATVSLDSQTLEPNALVGERLRAGITQLTADPHRSRWGQHTLESFVVVAVPRTAAKETEYWLVDLKAGEVRQVSKTEQDKSDWDIVGSADAWEKVIRGELNIHVAIRSSQLRYCGADDDGWMAMDSRVNITSALLGIGAW